jgi:RNA polymerase sigma factor (sigma-70 family)
MERIGVQSKGMTAISDGTGRVERVETMSMTQPAAWNPGDPGDDRSEREPDRGVELAGRLWREHRGWVAGVIAAHMPRGAEVDDLLQEVAVRLVQNIDSLDSPQAIGPWLRTVAINLARSAGRRHVRTQRIFQPFSEQEPDAGAADRHNRSIQESETASRGRQALDAVHSLPPAYRDPLLLSLRGLSYKHIGLALDLPVSTIETRLSRARAMVREELRAIDERENAEIGLSPDRDVAYTFPLNTPSPSDGARHE